MFGRYIIVVTLNNAYARVWTTIESNSRIARTEPQTIKNEPQESDTKMKLFLRRFSLSTRVLTRVALVSRDYFDNNTKRVFLTVNRSLFADIGMKLTDKFCRLKRQLTKCRGIIFLDDS